MWKSWIMRYRLHPQWSLCRPNPFSAQFALNVLEETQSKASSPLIITFNSHSLSLSASPVSDWPHRRVHECALWLMTVTFVAPLRVHVNFPDPCFLHLEGDNSFCNKKRLFSLRSETVVGLWICLSLSVLIIGTARIVTWKSWERESC